MVSRVLITDDEERIIRNIKVIFDEMENIEVVKAQDVTSIVDFVEHERLHLIITDLRVPKVGRLEFLKQVGGQCEGVEKLPGKSCYPE